jgi:prolyl-tRNA editing enzyme YbaK/EbsC (Cys-tRNA(Pro) deacylase)
VEGWPESVRRVAEFLLASSGEARIEEFAEPTPTARDAARAVGCELPQIVKSLVVLGDGKPAVVLVPGDRRADLAKVAAALGAVRVRVAGADEVRTVTGFDPGAVAPFPLPAVEHVLLERTLVAQEVVWVGAGSDRHMAGIRPGELLRLTRARSADVVDLPSPAGAAGAPGRAGPDSPPG